MENILNLINHSYPEGLEANEVYITFEYSKESFNQASEQVFDVWFGEKGDKFSLDEAPYSEFNYTKYYDKNDVAHLDWNYVNNNKIILNPLMSNDVLINNTNIQDSIKNVSISFDKIFAVYVNEDNDALYDVSIEHEEEAIDNKLT